VPEGRGMSRTRHPGRGAMRGPPLLQEHRRRQKTAISRLCMRGCFMAIV
jgi:hypothetical protein